MTATLVSIAPLVAAAPLRREPRLLRATETVPAANFAGIRRRMMLEYCKWDSQVGDVSTLAPFALQMPQMMWRELSSAAEQLAAETLQLESALLQRPDLRRRLGLPQALERLFRSSLPLTPAAARVMRFDFHLTSDGWRISEVNSDVPGGFTEASAFAAMMAEQLGGQLPGNPAAEYADALAANGKRIVLITAAGFIEDQQVVAGLSRLLEMRGCDAILAQPQQLSWRDGGALLANRPIDAVVRFYQAEWLAKLPRRTGWTNLFVAGRTPVANPPASALSESKRLPLLWDELNVPVPAWRRYLPETRDPRDVPWRTDERWLVKTAYCNTGDSVTLRERATQKQWRSTRLDVFFRPRQWLAQRRFQTLAVETPLGELFPCIGVYTINGRAAGIYGRLSRGPVTDYAAIDVAVLLEESRN